MRQFEGFANKIPFPSFPRDNVLRTITLSGLDPDAKFVEVEIVSGVNTPPPGNVFVLAPVGTTLPINVFSFIFGDDATYTTLTMRVDSAGAVRIRSNQPEGTIDFYVTGQWGGDGVIDTGPDYPVATGWTEENTGTYREFDLTPHIPVEHRGNVEAVLCHLVIGSGSGNHVSADARANGSTLIVPTQDTTYRQSTVVKVDASDLIEVREDGFQVIKDGPYTQDSWVYFAGYILAGEVNDGTGDLYEYKGIVDPVNDGLGDGEWATYDVRPLTSPTVTSIYWRLHSAAAVDLTYYAREVGSTDAALVMHADRWYTAFFPLTVDSSFEVEHFLEVSFFANTHIFGYLDFTGSLPDQATDPVPSHLSTGIDTDQTLGWTAGAGATSHDVYFGTSSTPGAGEFQGNQPGTTFNPGLLAQGTTYYWRIDEVNAKGTTTGVVWSFTTFSSVCIAATPSIFARVSAVTSTPSRVSATPSEPARVSAVTSIPGRVSATPSARRRVTAAASICGEGVNMKANTTCPDELPWNATAVLDLDEILDDLTDPGTPITSATSVTCSLYDVETGDELTAISPVTLSQVGSTNHWRESIDVTAANGFARKQRIRAVYHFNGGALLLGEFESLGVVGAAVN